MKCYLFFSPLLPADSDLIETFSERCPEGWQFPLCEPVENEIKYACDFFFFFLMASTNVGGGKKKKSSMVIDDSTKQKVRCLHSSVTLLFRHLYYDDNEGGGEAWIY